MGSTAMEFRFLRRLSCVVGMFFLAAVAAERCGGDEANDKKPLTYATSLFEGLRERLDSIKQYDVMIRVENSFLLENDVVPDMTLYWRVVMNADEQKCSYYCIEETFNFDRAVKGDLSRRKLREFAIFLDHEHAEHIAIGNTPARQDFIDFKSSLEFFSVPRISAVGLGKFDISMVEPGRTYDRATGIVATTKELKVVEGRRTSVSGVLHGKGRGKGYEERHQWLFAMDSLSPVAYEIRQGKTKGGRIRKIYSHEMNWDEREGYGVVPVKASSDSAVRLAFEDEEGVRSYKMAVRISDSQLKWTPYGKSGRAIHGAKFGTRDHGTVSKQLNELRSCFEEKTD